DLKEPAWPGQPLRRLQTFRFAFVVIGGWQMKVLSFAFLLVFSACAGTITTKNCGSNAITCSVATGFQNSFPAASINLAISPGSSPDASASVSIQEDFSILI